MRVAQLYLALYNAVQAVGWAACLGVLAHGLINKQTPEQLYASAGPLTKLFQGVSLLETLHAAVGLVPSSPVMALMQWAGRSNVLFLVLDAIPQLQSGWWGVAMLGAWSAAEVVRYPWYAATTLGACPGWLTWLRYTAFIPLYPLGVTAEMAVLADALPTLRTKRMYSVAMPNAYNFTFEYHVFIMVVLALYPFLWWQLYSSLLRSRSKKLKLAPQGPASSGSSSQPKARSD